MTGSEAGRRLSAGDRREEGDFVAVADRRFGFAHFLIDRDQYADLAVESTVEGFASRPQQRHQFGYRVAIGW